MRVFYTENSEADLQGMDNVLRKYFIKHTEKISKELPRRHMQFGLPYYVEEVTRQARLVYEVKNESLYVIRCFAAHKEYEKWYKSFK